MSNKFGRVLIADDEAIMRNLLKEILARSEYRDIVMAADGQEALDALSDDANDIRLAFLDLSMPAMGGLEVMELAKTLRPSCYCVVVSGHSDIDSVTNAITSGARAFIVKPYSMKKITDVLAKFEKAQGG